MPPKTKKLRVKAREYSLLNAPGHARVRDGLSERRNRRLRSGVSRNGKHLSKTRACFFVTTFVRIKEEGAFFVKVFETHTIMENLFFNLLWFWSSSSSCFFLGASSSRRPFVRVLYYMRSPDLSFSFLFFGDHTHTSVKTLYSMKTLNFTFFPFFLNVGSSFHFFFHQKKSDQ